MCYNPMLKSIGEANFRPSPETPQSISMSCQITRSHGSVRVLQGRPAKLTGNATTPEPLKRFAVLVVRFSQSRPYKMF